MKIIQILLIVGLVAVWQPTACAQEITEGKKHDISVGLNLFTPMGAIDMSSSFYNPYFSHISKNLCASFHVEYRWGFLGFRVPVRLPISQYEENNEPLVSDYYWYYDYRQTYTNYEVGFLPTFYFNSQDNPYQPFVYGGVYLGNSHGITYTSYETYAPDAMGDYVDYVEVVTYHEKAPARNYNRITLGTGTEYRFNNGFGVSGDLGLFLGKLHSYDQSRYSNYASTDGSFSLEYQSNYYRSDWGVQIGFNVTYHF